MSEEPAIEAVRRKQAVVLLHLRNTQLDLMDAKGDLASTQEMLDAAQFSFSETQFEPQNTRDAFVTFPIDQWLQSKYRHEEIPAFERTDESCKVLLNLMQINKAQDNHARHALQDLGQLSTSYRREDTHLREALQIIGLQKDHLSADSQQLLSQITELAMLLGLSDTTLSNFHQGQAHLCLDTIHYTQRQRPQKMQLQVLDSNQRQAQQDLEELLEMKRQWQETRETEVDLEQRTRRRSTELNRIKTGEDKETLLKMDETLHQQQRSGQDLETHELTIAQLDIKEKTVHELQELLESQKKTLSAYYDLPMDYSLANLKLKEATQRFEDLNAEHETMLTEIANDL